MRNRYSATYNSREIRRHIEAISDAKKEISVYESDISHYENSKKCYTALAEKKVLAIQALRENKDALNINLDNIDLAQQALTKQIKEREHKIKIACDEQSIITQKISQYERYIAVKMKNITDKDLKIKELTDNLTSLNQYEQSLKDQPEELYNKLKEKILATLNKNQFRNYYLYSYDRKCIADIHKNISAIDSLPLPAIDPAQQITSKSPIWRARYFLLLQLIRNAGKNYEVTTIPTELEEKYPAIDIKELTDIPDFDPYYIELCILYHHQNSYSNEKTEYLECYRKLHTALAQSDFFKETGSAVLEAIDDERKAFENEFGEDTFNGLLNYYTHVIKKMHDIVVQPTLEKITAFKPLIHHANGQQSTWGKTTGLLMGFLGVAIIAASIFVAVVSLGGAAPISIGGMILGKSMLIGGIACATAAVAGPYMTYKGVSFFNSSRSNGVCEKMESFAITGDEHLKEPEPVGVTMKPV